MVDVLGYRRKIGIITDAANTVVAGDVMQCALTGVTYHFSDLPDDGYEGVADASRRMAHKGPAGVALLLDELLFDEGRVGRFAGQLADLPVAHVRHALADAFAVSGYSREIALITPFAPDTHKAARAVLEDAGLTIVADRGLDVATADQAHIRFVDQRAALAPLITDRVGAIVQLGHNMPFARLVDNIEEDYDRPVFAANTVTLWKLLRDLGVEDVIPGVGRLLIHH